MTDPTPFTPAPSESLSRLWIAAGLSLGPAVSNGAARFAYALILPGMRTDLAWSYSQAGWMNTANALGYLVGALAAWRWGSLLKPRQWFDGGMAVTGLALIAMALTRSFPLMVGLRLFTGVANALLFVFGGVLAASVFRANSRHATAAIGVYFGGGGAGILLTGVSIPWLFEHLGNGAWVQAWITLGAGTLVATVVGAFASRAVTVQAAQRAKAVWRWWDMRWYFIAYGLFSIGYISYMTFLIAWMRGQGSPVADITRVWGVIGLAVMVSPVLWNRMLRTAPGGRPMAVSLMITAVGAALPLVGNSLPLLLASALLFGGSFFIAPASVTAFSKKSLPPAAWGPAIAAYMAVFAAGQSVGPLLTGMLADASGSLFAGLAVSAGLLALGAGLALMQKDFASQAQTAT